MQRIGLTECKAIKAEDIHSNRYLDCADYDDCLDEAAIRGLKSFHCNNCHAFLEFKAALERDERYDIFTGGRNISVQRFFPNKVDVNEKNIGTIWND